MSRIFIYIFILTAFCTSQNYIWPTDASKSLSSNFGEYRNRHFHMGLDIKTREGAAVFAVDTGYVSRMVANFKGYGRALYIIHPNGKTSVYAHFSSFYPTLEGQLKYYQTVNNSYIVDHYFEVGENPIARGALLGYSGNTGYSYGPHLHFELRNNQEQPLNPQTYGFAIDDRAPPVIAALAVLPLDEAARVNGSILPIEIPFSRNHDGKNVLVDTLNIFGPVGFALKAHDVHTGFANTYQVYSITLVIDGNIEYVLKFDHLDYDTADQVQLVRNHSFKRLNLGTYHNLYQTTKGIRSEVQSTQLDGIIKLSPGYHQLEVRVTDANGNTASGSGLIFDHPPVTLILQDVYQIGNDVFCNIQPTARNIPLQRITCYSFFPSGYADLLIEPVNVTKKDGGLVITLDSRLINDRAMQFIAKDKMGAYSTPLNWYPDRVPIDCNATPEISLKYTAAGMIIQVETANMGAARPDLELQFEIERTGLPLHQIQPYTYISNPLSVMNFSGIQSMNVAINANIETTYKQIFKPVVATPGNVAVMLSNDNLCSLQTRKSTVYEPVLIWIETVKNSIPPPHGTFLSNVYQLQPFDVPLQDTILVGIRYDERVSRLNKISLYYYNQDEDWVFIASENKTKQQMLTGSLLSLEAVCILQDDVPPTITSTFPADGGKYDAADVVQLRAGVSDLLSGIAPEEASISLTLNGKTLLYTYQPVDQTISYDLLADLRPGEQHMTLAVADRSGNSTETRVSFKIK